MAVWRRLVSIWNRQPSRRRRALLGASTACLLVAFSAGVLLWWSSDSIRFDAERLGRQDAAQLVQLRDDLRLIVNWNPPFAQPEASQTLAEWILLPDNASAQRWEELGRSQMREFARLNGMLKLLRDEPEISLTELRQRESAELASELQAIFTRIAVRRREASLAKVVATPAHRSVLERWKVTPFPHSKAARTGWRRLFRTDPAEAVRWAENVALAIDQQVWPVEQLYRETEAKSSFALGAAGDLQLQLKRLVSLETGSPAVIHAGPKTLSDWELWVRMKAEVAGEADEAGAQLVDGQLHEWDTGIRLVCVPWTEDAANAERPRRPVWPPSSSCVGCEIPQVDEFLREMGLPRGLAVASATLDPAGDWTKPSATLRFVLSSSQFPDWRHEGRLSLPLSTLADWRNAVSQAAAAARQDLHQFVLTQSQYCGCPTRFAASRDSARTLEATFDHPQWGSFRLLGALDDDGRLAWQSLPPVEDRMQITQRLLSARPELQAHSDRLVLTVIELRPDRDQLEVRWRLRSLPGETPSAQEALVWQTNARSTERSQPPAIPSLPPPPPKPAPPAGARLVSEAAVKKALEQHLAQSYGAIGKNLRVLTTTNNAGVAVSLALKISDWPELSLGPAAVESLEQAVASVDKLLEKDSVQSAIGEQWNRGDGLLEHPRYGPIRSTLDEWRPLQGRAKIRSAITFPYLGAVDWEEKAEAKLDGAWTQVDEAAMALEMRPDVDEALAAAQDELLSWVGLPGVGRVEVDPHGIEGNRWLSMSPPRIALRCWARIPYLGVKLQGGRCWLDTSGLHAPKELSIGIPGTLSLPYFALSEPAISFGIGERSLSVAGKVTPPSPPGPINPWLKVGYTEVELGGELSKSGWQAPKLRGSGDIAVAGTTNVAHGGLGVDFAKGDVDGDFLARAPLPGMTTVPARLDGKLAYRGEVGAFDLGGRGKVSGQEIANINFMMGRKDAQTERPFDLTGRVQVPYVASVTVKGDAAQKMDRFTLHGKGSAGPLVCRFKATEAGVNTETGVENGDGSTTYVEEWDPSLATLNAPEPGVEAPPPAESQLRSLTESVPKRQLTESERQFAKRKLTMEVDIEEGLESPPETQVRTSDAPPRAYREYGSSAFKRDGATIVVRTPDERVLCRIPAEHLADLKINTFGLAMIIEWADRGGGEILFCQVDQGTWARLTFHSDQTSLPAQVRTLESLGIVGAPVSPQAPDFVRRRDMLWKAVKVGFELGVLRSAGQGDVLRPQRLPFPDSLDGYAFEVPPRKGVVAALPPNRRWFWDDDGVIISIDMASPWVSRNVESRQDFCTALRAAERGLRSHLARPAILATLVAAAPPTESFPEWSLGWVIHHRQDLPNDLIVWNTPQGLKQLTLAPHESSDEELWSHGQAIVRGAWKRPALSGRTAWIGPGGAFLDDEARYWIVADRGLDEPECEALSRQAWIDWTGEHARFLPRAWQSRDVRRALPVEQLAHAVLRDWDSVRSRDDDFAVHPLGLLLLAGREDKSLSALNPTSPAPGNP